MVFSIWKMEEGEGMACCGEREEKCYFRQQSERESFCGGWYFNSNHSEMKDHDKQIIR